MGAIIWGRVSGVKNYEPIQPIPVPLPKRASRRWIGIGASSWMQTFTAQRSIAGAKDSLPELRNRTESEWVSRAHRTRYGLRRHRTRHRRAGKRERMSAFGLWPGAPP